MTLARTLRRLVSKKTPPPSGPGAACDDCGHALSEHRTSKGITGLSRDGEQVVTLVPPHEGCHRLYEAWEPVEYRTRARRVVRKLFRMLGRCDCTKFVPKKPKKEKAA